MAIGRRLCLRLVALTTLAAIGAGAYPDLTIAAQTDASEGHGAVVEGMVIYLGVLPSDIIAKGYGKDTPEYRMERNAPRGVHYHHVLIALYEQQTGKRITDATVTATVREIGLEGTTKKMNPFDVAGAMTYCNYFNMPTFGQYRIDLKIERPGIATPVEATLHYDHVAGN